MLQVRKAVSAVLRSARACPTVLLGGVLFASFGANVSFAQTADEDEELTEVVTVTGTRIQQQRQDYVAPNPVVSVTGEDLQMLGMNNVSDAITTLIPQNISNYQPTNTGLGSFFIGSTIANLRGLDPAFGSRTLTLINGRRVVSTSNQADVVDMNIIPSNLLARMDVVTGGASAAYGSGAMAGVVNLMLDTRMQGLKVDMDYGATTRGDGENKHVALSGGTSLFSGRGHILVSGEWQKQDAIRSCADARDWCGEGRGLFTNNSNSAAITPGTPTTPYPEYAGMPYQVFLDNRRYSQFSPNGVIAVQNSNATQGWRFTEDGRTIEPYNLGVRGGVGPGQPVENGDGPVAATMATLTPGYDRKTAFTHFEFDFTDRVRGYAEGNFAKTDATNVQWPTQDYACVQFNTPATQAVPGRLFQAGVLVPFTDPIWFSNPTFWQQIPNGISGFGPTGYTPPTTYQLAGIPAQGGSRGPNENAYLRNLSPEAITAMQAASAGMNPGGFFQGNAPNSGEASLGCLGQVNLYKVWAPQIVQSTWNGSETYRGVLGAKGSYLSTWTWDAYYQYGKTESSSIQYNAKTRWRYNLALDSVIDPATGQPVCRSTLEGVRPATWYGDPLNIDPRLANGCLPINPFGSAAGVNSQEALSFAFRDLVSLGETRLDVVSLNTSGQLWKGWGAGPLSAAFGLEYRRDKVDNRPSNGEDYERSDFTYQWADAFGGKTSVVEEYIELQMPLIRDVPAIRLFSLNGAVRHAEYKNKGGAGTTGEEGTQDVTNWKVSAVWEPLDWLRLRGTRSRDLRAAGYRELYYASVSPADSSTLGSPFSRGNPWRPYTGPNDAVNTMDQYASRFVGNPELKPEESNTTTAGFVLSPGGWAQGMHFSADYYHIRVKDGLTVSFSQPAQLCWEQSGSDNSFDPNNQWCQMLEFGNPDPRTPTNPYSNVTFVDTTYANNQPFLTRGVDIAWDYAFPVSKLFDAGKGNVMLRLTGNRAIESSGVDFLGRQVDAVGQLGGGLFLPGIQATPEWSGSFIASYFHGPGALTLSARYVGKGKIDSSYPYAGPGDAGYQDANGNFLVGSIDNNDVPSYLNFSLNGSYNLRLFNMQQFQLFGSVNNLFDKDPPFTAGYIGGANPIYHDTLGRSYRVGVRMQF